MHENSFTAHVAKFLKVWYSYDIQVTRRKFGTYGKRKELSIPGSNPGRRTKFSWSSLWQTEDMTVSEAFAKFRQDLIDLLKKHKIAKPDPRWDESDILKAFTEYLERSSSPAPKADMGRVVYDAYRNHTGGKSLATGQTIPEWDQLRPDIQEAWRVAHRVSQEAQRATA